MSQDLMLNSALSYCKKFGFSVIPVNDKKIPLLPWQRFQKEKPNEAQIRQWWGSEFRDANVGIVTGAISNLTVVDTDSDAGFAALLPYLDGAAPTPVARTPKGNHFYFSFVEGVGNKGRFLEDCDVRSEGGYVVAPPSIVNGKQYTWTKDKHIKSTALAAPPLSLITLLKSNTAFTLYKDVVTPEKGTLQTVTSVTKRNMCFNEGSRDEAIFHVANYLLKGGMPIGEVEQLLSLIAAKVCNPPFPEREVAIKINSALKRAQTRERNLTSEIQGWLSVTGRYVTITECDRELQIVTSAEKAHRRVVFHRLVKNGVLESDDKRPGYFRKVEKEFEAVDIMEIEAGELFNVRLPFGMEQYIEVFPKDLLVLAGAPNAGKTALMLETLRLNQSSHKCFYFSSEMGRHNCKKRLSKCVDCQQWKFRFVDDFKSFVDVIQPDDLNFVDYVEVPDGEYYKIPSILAGIQRKLRKGVAIVALQKNPDKQGKDGRVNWAVGGAQTLAKPAVFVTIDQDYPGAVMRIVKAKNFKDKNPNGFEMRFSIRDGINLIPRGIWKPEMEA